MYTYNLLCMFDCNKMSHTYLPIRVLLHCNCCVCVYCEYYSLRVYLKNTIHLYFFKRTKCILKINYFNIFFYLKNTKRNAIDTIQVEIYVILLLLVNQRSVYYVIKHCCKEALVYIYNYTYRIL